MGYVGRGGTGPLRLAPAAATMYPLSHCPCCDTAIERTVPAVLAPFIRERISCSKPDAELCKCATCGFLCYRDRYDETETAALYDGYRGQRYLKQRQRHEPWYTNAINESIGGPEEVERRNARLDAFLLSTGVLNNARSVLDWGGDRGQFIPTRFPERYVYDISGVAPEPGVAALAASQLTHRQFDLVIVAHVLEHASDPKHLLRQVLNVRARYLYVEVPYELPPIGSVHESRAYARWVHNAARSSGYPVLALVSLVTRVKLGLLPAFAVMQQHEHLNYFSESTLCHLLAGLGCNRIASISYKSAGLRRRAEALGVLVSAVGL